MIQPSVQPLDRFSIQSPRAVTFPNGVQIHLLPGGDEEVIRIDLLFHGGVGISRNRCKRSLPIACCAREAARSPPLR